LVHLLVLAQSLRLFDVFVRQKLQILLCYFELILHEFKFVGRLSLQNDHTLIAASSLLQLNLQLVLQMYESQQLLLDNVVAFLHLAQLVLVVLVVPLLLLNLGLQQLHVVLEDLLLLLLLLSLHLYLLQLSTQLFLLSLQA